MSSAIMESAAKKTRYERRAASYGLTLVEILIVVAVLGILAALIIPEYQNYTQRAKESAAKENLHILRIAIERYAATHNGIAPGYPSDNASADPDDTAFQTAIIDGGYLSQIPKNPFNKQDNILVLQNDQFFPESASDDYGWIYKPSTKDVRLNQQGTDSIGVNYYEY